MFTAPTGILVLASGSPSFTNIISVLPPPVSTITQSSISKRTGHAKENHIRPPARLFITLTIIPVSSSTCFMNSWLLPAFLTAAVATVITSSVLFSFIIFFELTKRRDSPVYSFRLEIPVRFIPSKARRAISRHLSIYL